ncbi:hypothetical protein, partial [Planococcus sp. CAU13]|uniref:hypothetical protein n=1 Tax=Planococcus sp. CAU13 TaxID=1541197 RepID=UPI001F2EFD05
RPHFHLIARKWLRNARPPKNNPIQRFRLYILPFLIRKTRLHQDASRFPQNPLHIPAILAADFV